jgi:hypothetical protein
MRNAGVFALTVLIPAVAKERASMEFVFTHCYSDDGVGIHSKVYTLAIGLLTSQYSLLGYDTSAHMVKSLTIASTGISVER